MLEEKRNFAVVAKCGHVGLGHYIPIEFAVKAYSKKEAASIARDIPRVKHDHKDAILQAREISNEEYLEIRQRNHCDPYLQCKNFQEQKSIFDEIKDRLVVDGKSTDLKSLKKKRKERVEFKMKKRKI